MARPGGRKGRGNPLLVVAKSYDAFMTWRDAGNEKVDPEECVYVDDARTILGFEDFEGLHYVRLNGWWRNRRDGEAAQIEQALQLVGAKDSKL